MKVVASGSVASAVSGLPGAGAAVEDGDGVVTEHLEGPVDAGGGAELARIGAVGDDHHVLVIVDAELADQRRGLLHARELARDAVDLLAPARSRVGGADGAGDVGGVVGEHLLDRIADVEDDEALIAEVGLEPGGIDQRLVGEALGQDGGGNREAEGGNGRKGQKAHEKLHLAKLAAG